MATLRLFWRVRLRPGESMGDVLSLAWEASLHVDDFHRYKKKMADKSLTIPSSQILYDASVKLDIMMA
jgi:hypothetical protein